VLAPILGSASMLITVGTLAILVMRLIAGRMLRAANANESDSYVGTNNRATGLF
jgi:hypothetical protein